MPEVSQGSSLLRLRGAPARRVATLGFIAESLWDSRSLASIKIRERRSEDGRTPSQSPRLVALSKCSDSGPRKFCHCAGVCSELNLVSRKAVRAKAPGRECSSDV